jgi:hypothetical protein
LGLNLSKIERVCNGGNKTFLLTPHQIFGGGLIYKLRNLKKSQRPIPKQKPKNKTKSQKRKQIGRSSKMLPF